MKYFENGKNQNGYGIEAIILGDNVFSIAVSEENKIIFMEECDGYFSKELNKDDAIEMLNEAIDWIKANAL